MSLKSKSDQLEAQFAAESEILRSKIETAALASLPDVRAQLEAVRELLAQGTEWWTKYDVRRNSEKLLSLEKDVDIVARRLKPRRRFRFSQAPSLETPEALPQSASSPKKVALPAGPLENGVIVDSRSVRNGKVEIDNFDGKPLTVMGLKDACVFLKGTPTALRLTNLTRCEVQGVLVNGSVFVSECGNCSISVVCHQLRIHQSNHCSFWTCSDSGPIIEDCTNMRFGELLTEGRRGGWNDIKDFSWLREGHSPNWQLLNNTRVFPRPTF